MSIEFSHMTPYLIFIFGCVGTFIAWSTREILQNIKDDLKETAVTVKDHGNRLSTLESGQKLIEYKVQTLDSKVAGISKAGKIVEKRESDAQLR